MEDRDIIQDILDGEIDKFELLVEKYRKSVFLVVGKRIPAQDHEIVAQDVFIKAFKGLPGFDLKRPFENWLVTIAMRTCFDYWRKASKGFNNATPSIEEEHDDWIERAGKAKSIETFEKEVSRKETLEVLDLVMQNLSAEDRMLLELVYFEGWKLKDVATLLGWKLSKAKVRAMRSRNLLREQIGEFLS